MPDYNLQAIAFPTLDESQIAELGRFADAGCRRYRDGETLIPVGERDFKFLVVKAGEIEIIDHTGDAPKTIVVHHGGQFTGEVALLMGAPAVASAVARGDAQVYELSREALQRVLNQRPALSDIILQAFLARRQLLRASPEFTGLRVIGSRYSSGTFRIRDFLAKNRVLFTWLDLETDPEVARLLKQFGVPEAETPVVACGRKLLLRNPSNRELAEAVGILRPPEQTLYDLVVMGAGPAGLAAAVNGASEGLRTVMLERTAPGGQAGSSMRIENYLGFPTGVTGSKLADLALAQVRKFGAHLSVPAAVTRLAFEETYPILHVEGGESVATKCLLIATGIDYRRLGVARCEEFEGRGVYNAATPAEGELCAGAEVLVVGAATPPVRRPSSWRSTPGGCCC